MCVVSILEIIFLYNQKFVDNSFKFAAIITSYVNSVTLRNVTKILSVLLHYPLIIKSKEFISTVIKFTLLATHETQEYKIYFINNNNFNNLTTLIIIIKNRLNSNHRLVPNINDQRVK